MAQARLTPVDEGYGVAKQGVAALIANILDSGADTERVNKALVDSMIVELDKKLSQQMDLLCTPSRCKSWSPPGVHSSCWWTAPIFGKNIKIQLLHATKAELLEDFEFAAEITQSGLYKHVYASGYGQFRAASQ